MVAFRVLAGKNCAHFYAGVGDAMLQLVVDALALRGVQMPTRDERVVGL